MVRLKLHELTEKLHDATRVWRPFRYAESGLERCEGFERVQPIEVPNRTALAAIGDALPAYSPDATVEYLVGGVPTPLDQLHLRTDNQLEWIQVVLSRPYADADAGQQKIASVELFGNPQTGRQGRYFGRLAFYLDAADSTYYPDSLIRAQLVIDAESKHVGRLRRLRSFPVLDNISGDESRNLRRDRQIRWQSAGISLAVAVAAFFIEWALTGGGGSAPGS